MIIRENQAVYVEDLCVAGLGRTRLAKSVHDAGWSAFVAMLEYKAARYGRTFARTGRFEPTSQVCSACGARDGPKPLSVRSWTCAACRTVHDRDINAARNVLALGRRESLNACRGGVRPGATPGGCRRNRKPQRCRMTRHRLNPPPSGQGARQSPKNAAARRDISSGETSSMCWLIIHCWPKGSHSRPPRSP